MRKLFSMTLRKWLLKGSLGQQNDSSVASLWKSLYGSSYSSSNTENLLYNSKGFMDIKGSYLSLVQEPDKKIAVNLF